MMDSRSSAAKSETIYTAWKGWREEDFGKPSHAEMRYFDAEIGARVTQQSERALLEIGFGNGALLGWATTQFGTVVGVEQSQILVQRARKAGFIAFDSIEAAPADQKYDVVVAMDVLEHLTSDDIEALLRAIALRLKPDGCFIARFPNGDSPFGRIVQNGDVTHINAIGYIKMDYFAERSGLNLEYIAAPARVPERSLRKSAEQLWNRLMRYVFERAIASLYFPRRLSFDMNYVAVLRKAN